jgi:hypothetical protein
MTPYTYITTPQLERAVLKQNPEFSTFSQALAYRFNLEVSESNEWGEVSIKGSAGDIVDALRYFQLLSF